MTAAERNTDDRQGNLLRRLGQSLDALPWVRLAYLFGSRARGTARADSDFDVAVLVDDDAVRGPGPTKDAIWALSGAMGRVVGSDRLDVVLLNGASALLRHRVIGDGLLLLARSEAQRVRFVFRAIQDYQDVEPRLREHTRRRILRLREGRTDGRRGDLLEAARRAGRLLGATTPPR